jgi:gliding motility associated protien GldN
MTLDEVSKVVTGGTIMVKVYDSLGNEIGEKPVQNEVNLDSFYKFQVKEEVIFDKEASRLFWRILGIAPVQKLMTSTGIQIGDQAYPLFWVYYPDLRPTFAKYEVYNGKNFGARMTWEELFENRMFSGRIIKSTIDNPMDIPIAQQPGLKENGVFQLLEGERIKEKVFNYELDLWSY